MSLVVWWVMAVHSGVRGLAVVKPARLLGEAYLFGAIVLLLGLPLLPTVVPRAGDGHVVLIATASAALGALLHESVHLAAANLLGVRGLRLRWTPHGPTLVHDGMTREAWLVIALAPLAISAALMACSLLTPAPLPKLVVFDSSWVSAASSGADVAGAARVIRAPRRANVLVLYDEAGRVVGGVVEGRELTVLLLKKVEATGFVRRGNSYIALRAPEC